MFNKPQPSRLTEEATKKLKAVRSAEPLALSQLSSQPSPRGRDLVQAVLAAAKQQATTSSERLSSAATGSQEFLPRRAHRRRWSGPGPDQRDPQALGAVVNRLAGDRGWHNSLANGRLVGQWNSMVGAEVAEHAQPLSLRDGELVIQASSTAWATQLRLLQSQLLARIAARVGHGVVKRMRIQGPAAPSWRKGAWHVAGKGPRDTYG